MEEYKIIDVTNWKRTSIYLKGTKEKTDLMEPDTERRAMFKEPAEGSGDIWSEKIASEIGKIIEFDVQEVELAKFDKKYGNIVYYSIDLKEEELKEGADLIKSDEPNFNEWRNHGYDFQLIEKTLGQYNNKLIIEFLKIIVFDILIGNTDRHSQNWGIVINGNNIRMATAYDNSSSLGREFHSNKNKSEIKLKDEKSFKAYCHSKKGSYMIGWKGIYGIPHFEFLELLYEEYPEEISINIKKLKKLSDEVILKIVRLIPKDIMKEVNKQLTIKILKYRRDYMIEFIEKKYKEGE